MCWDCIEERHRFIVLAGTIKETQMTQSQGSIEQLHLFGEQKKTGITNRDKMVCARREAELRRRVYGGLVRNGRMSQEKADYEVAVMEAIANDYRILAAGE
jgi:hypothetical protein